MDDLDLSDPIDELKEGLVKYPTLERYRKMMKQEYFGRCQNAVFYLREYESGLAGIEILLRLTEEFKANLTIDEYKINRWGLWRFYLVLLDKMDRWEDWVATVESIRQDPEGRECLTEVRKVRFSSGGWNYESPVEAEKQWTHSVVDRREPLILKKIALKKAGASLKRFMHKKPEQLSDEEYQRRKEQMKYRAECAKAEWESMKQHFKERKEQQEEEGPRADGMFSIEVDLRAMEEAVRKLEEESVKKGGEESGEKKG